MSFFVYILRSTSNELYIGQTNNLDSREQQQLTKSAKAAKFIKDGASFKLAYQEKHNSRLEAMRRERQLKGWSRAKKEALIRGDLDMLRELSKTRSVSKKDK